MTDYGILGSEPTGYGVFGDGPAAMWGSIGALLVFLALLIFLVAGLPAIARWQKRRSDKRGW